MIRFNFKIQILIKKRSILACKGFFILILNRKKKIAKIDKDFNNMAYNNQFSSKKTNTNQKNIIAHNLLIDIIEISFKKKIRV